MNKKQAKLILDEINGEYDCEIKLNSFINLLDQYGEYED